VARRTYLTGGMGSRHADEAFGDDFVLPPDRSYSETCAAVASVMLSWRLLLATGEARYADLIERTLFNVIATSPADDGRAFFYANTLHQRQRGAQHPPDSVSPRPVTSTRAPWFGVSCCPNNVARMLASLPGYLATADAKGLQIHQYADADIDTKLDGQTPVSVRVRTRYPDDGTVSIEVAQAPATPMTITLRVPSWAAGRASVARPGSPQRPVLGDADTVDVTGVFAAGDVIRLQLPMEPRWTVADPRVDAVRGQLALERGPLVLCTESADLPSGVDVDAVRIDPGERPVDHGGWVAVSGSLVESGPAGWPYRDDGQRLRGTRSEAELCLRPYHSWARRGPATMRIWMPQ
jgi:hypothetical protein